MHVLAYKHSEDETPAVHDARTRWAYLVVGQDEMRAIDDKIAQDEAAIETIKEKFLPFLESTVKLPEPALYTERHSIDDHTPFKRNFGGKVITLLSSVSLLAPSIKDLLRAKQYTASSSKNESENGEHKHFSYLESNSDLCHDCLKEEKGLLSRDKAFAMLALPYVYNKAEGRYEAHYDVEQASVAFMPKVTVEYGVFFDGTKNNMYNIDFNLAFYEHLSKMLDIIIGSEWEDTSRASFYDVYSQMAYAIKNGNEPVNIIQKIRTEILNSNIRYFQKESFAQDSNGYDKAFKDAKKVYEYLHEVKKGRIESEIKEAQEDGVIPENDSARADAYKKTVIQKFIYEEILPEGEGSSFVNGYTNIKRLFEHYKGYDAKAKNVEAQRFAAEGLFNRFKVYASGDGCVDPFEENRLASDSTIGLGLAFGTTGVRAHIIYTCKKIIETLRKYKMHDVNELVLDVFGFSRGAAEARHFVSSIMKSCTVLEGKDRPYTLDTQKGSKTLFDTLYDEDNGLYACIGHDVYFNPLRTDVASVVINDGNLELEYKNPYYGATEIDIESLSFRFVGVYDTVPHYGMLQHNDSEDLNLDMDSSKLGRLVHIVAADEYRKNFELMRVVEADNIIEFSIPGAHADVGGGYMAIEDSPRYIADNDLERVLAWNDTYGWMKYEEDQLFVLDVEEEKDIRRLRKNGFYRIKNTFTADKIYMYRPYITDKYMYVGMNLMHHYAINVDDRVKSLRQTDKELEKVPFRKLNAQYILEGELKTVHDELKNDTFEMHGKKHISLRQTYLHHSADIVNYAPFDVNAPSMENYFDWQRDELYGDRVSRRC